MNLPADVLRVIYSYVPHKPKVKTPEGSPSLQKELSRIQSKFLSGKSAMFMYELDDFMLDGYCSKQNN
jgi:hypothetical protein